MEIGPGSPRPALTRVMVWVTVPLCKGGAGVRGFFLNCVRGLLLTLMPGMRVAPRRSSFFFKKRSRTPTPPVGAYFRLRLKKSPHLPTRQSIWK